MELQIRDDFEARGRKRQHSNHADTDIPACGVAVNDIQSM